MRISTFLAVAALSFAGLALTGCGPDCQSSCEKLYGDGTDRNGEPQCNIELPGKEGAAGAQEMTRDCVAHCEHALARNGDIGDYKPNERASGNDEVSLDNEQQAALWMDCVEETSCVNLNPNGGGYCAPVSNF